MASASSTSSSDMTNSVGGWRGLSRLAAKLALFAAPLILVALGIERGMRIHPDEMMRKRKAWERSLDSTRILILGSSHAQFALRPDALGEPAFNLAGFSQTLRYDSALLSRSIARMPRLKTVILTISYFTFEDELGPKGESWRCWSYRDAWGIEVPSTLKRWNPMRFSRALRYGNWRSFIQALHGFRPLPELVPIGPDGWGEAYEAHPSRKQDSGWARDRISQWKSSANPMLRPSEIHRLASILEMARSANLKVVLVATPVLEPLRELESPAVHDENRRDVDSLARAYGAKWLDLEADPSFTNDDFVDMDHLGPDGARKLTFKVAEFAR